MSRWRRGRSVGVVLGGPFDVFDEIVFALVELDLAPVNRRGGQFEDIIYYRIFSALKLNIIGYLIVNPSKT